MLGSSRNPAAVARLKVGALGSTALSALSLVAIHAAHAQPPANSLPGSFSANGAVTYTGTSSTAATITTVGGANNVLQWGGTALGTNVTAPSGITPNTGFSIGQGATLQINQNGAGATSVLVTDLTGGPSQIFGTLDASSAAAGAATALSGPLFVSNANGIIVGPSGVIHSPSPGGIGLLGYAVDATAFATNGFVTVDNTTPGTGSVTTMAGATIDGGNLLVASNGTVNIGASAPSTVFNYVVAGFPFTTFAATTSAAADVTPTVGTTALNGGGSSVVNFTPAAANATLFLDQLNAAGAVNNQANLVLFADNPTGTPDSVLGLFTNTNTGVLTDMSSAGDFSSNQLAGGLVNNGVINEASTGTTTLDIESNGNVQSKGTLNVPTGGGLTVVASNIDIEGSVQVAGQVVSATNPLSGVFLQTLGAGGTVANPSTPQTGGVVDLATSLYTNGTGGSANGINFGAVIQGNVIRVLPNGNVFDTAENIGLFPGTNAKSVADPFYNLPSLNYTLSLFGGTLVQATTGNIYIENPSGGTQFSDSSGVNLLGTLATLSPTSSINVVANNINSNNGLNAGFSVPNGGTINLIFYGNVNNPNGAAANGSTAFQYNYVPVTVGPNGNAPGTANIYLAGPSASSAIKQNVNLLVQGNVQLGDGNGVDPVFTSYQNTVPLTAPTLPTSVLSSYANNHLVVTATGNIGLNPSLAAGLANPNIFYWPGLVWLMSGASASNPTAAPNSTASIALGDTATTTSVNLFNLIPADLTMPDVGGQIGGSGVHYLTNNLILAPGTNGTSATTTSNNSWVNFLTPALTTEFLTTSAGQFSGGTIESGQVDVIQLPATDFQPQ